MKKIEWHELPRTSRLANVMYPHLSHPETQRDIAALARGEGKKSPLQVHMEKLRPNQGRRTWWSR
jgi:hypothetical protein